jgi:hypothetical protein
MAGAFRPFIVQPLEFDWGVFPIGSKRRLLLNQRVKALPRWLRY